MSLKIKNRYYVLYLSLFSLFFLSSMSNAFSQKNIDWRKLSNNTQASFYDVQRNFNEFWSSRIPQKGQGYKTFKRWEYIMKPRVFPSGDMGLPSSTYHNFLEWKAKLPREVIDHNRGSGWTSLGPNAIPSGYDGANGRIDFVRFHPNNNQILFVGGPDGGLWKSVNGGISWTTNTDFLPIVGCSDLVINPANPQIMYLATGTYDGSPKRSIGVLKTTDGGATWLPTGLSWTATDNYAIRRLIMHPTNPMIMMIATSKGIFKTTNGWNTYSQVDNTLQLFDIEFKPNDPNIVYACGENYVRSSDGGNTWTSITTGLPTPGNTARMMLAVTPANPNYVYIIAGTTSGQDYQGTFRSTDAGLTFTTQSTTPNILGYEKVNSPAGAGQAFHDLALVVSPVDANLVTMGGISAYQSTDGGVTWSCVAFWYGVDPQYPGSGNQDPPYAEYVHADVQDLQYLPGSSSTMFLTCDGGIYKTTNNGGNWSKISSNLSISQQYALALSSSSPNIIESGEQDIGNVRWDGTSWHYFGGGDGMDGFYHRDDHNVLVSSDTYGTHQLSFDGGNTRSNITGLPQGNTNEWFCPISFDPVQDSTVYVGGRVSLYRKTDLFTNNNGVWEILGPPPGTGNVIRFAVAPSNNQIIYVIKTDAVSKSINGGTTWTNITGALPINEASPSNITVSNTNANKLWVTFSGYSEGNKVFKSADGGITWVNESSGLPNLPMNTIVYVNNSANDELYLGGDIGVYFKDNTNSNWLLANSDLPNCMVTDLEIFYPASKLRASTFGRGAWERDIFNSNNDCSLTVLNTNDDGFGSLRRAIACALDGNTILFSPTLTDGIGNDTIKLTSGPILISKNLTIQQTPSTRPLIKAVGSTGPIFTIAGSKTFTLKDVILHSGTNATGRALVNQGNLHLENVFIHEKINTAGSGSTLSNNGNIEVQGEVKIIIDP